MKTTIIALLLLICASAFSQDLMTVGEVFDFNIGDEFHYHLTPSSVPPAIDRITLTGKFYSEAGDTVFYIRYHDSYWTEVDWDPVPHLIYHFYTKTDTIHYNNLDLPISNYDYGFQCDTSLYVCDTNLYYSVNFCNTLINGYYIETNDFEPEIYQKEYGQGLGWVWDYYYSTSSLPPGVQWDAYLFYYLKSGIECGTPDTITVSVPEIYNYQLVYSVAPNPAKDFINLSIPGVAGTVTLTLTDLAGGTVYFDSFETPLDRSIQLDSFKPGMYLGTLKSSLGISVFKIVIE